MVTRAVCRVCKGELNKTQIGSEMKAITVRLPETVIAEIKAESRERNVTVSDVVRERLQLRGKKRRQPDGFAPISDLSGSVRGLPADISSRKKQYLKSGGYGRKHSR